jgi:hypothetical protein
VPPAAGQPDDGGGEAKLLRLRPLRGTLRRVAPSVAPNPLIGLLLSTLLTSVPHAQVGPVS